MRAELHWSYFTAGAMNTANAAGYLLGALLAPRWFARHDALRVPAAGGVATAAILVGARLRCAAMRRCIALRMLAGVASAATFVGGGLLAARLSARAPHPGLVVGLYYGGAGPGHPRRDGAGAAAAVARGLDRAGRGVARVHARDLGRDARVARRRCRPRPTRRVAPRARVPWTPMAHAAGRLPAVRLRLHRLHDLHRHAAARAGHRAGLGRRVLRPAGRGRGGVVVAVGRRAAALSRRPGAGAAERASWRSRRCCRCSARSRWSSRCRACCSAARSCRWWRRRPRSCATTCRRRRGRAGIGAFTIVFALGQILGPSLTGHLADGPGGLRRGFVCSAIVLALGAVSGRASGR